MLPFSEILDKINPKEKNTLVSGEYFLSLVIGERQVQAGIWNFSAEGGQGLAYGSWEAWSGGSAEELIVAADASIASAIANLPEIFGKQPTKVILGLPEFWVEGQAIRKEKLEILQTVCKKLLLKPLGFVVTPEAIAHFLKKEEGGSSSLILVSIGESEITVSLILQGKFLGSKVVGRSNSLALDLEEGLLRFNLESALPARIMLLGGKDLEEERQTLISYPWVAPDNGKKFGFLQFPKVEIAKENFEMASVVLAGSHELGDSEKEISSPPPETKELPLPENVVEEDSSSILSEEDFGFVKGKDIALVVPPEETIKEEPKEEFAGGIEQKEPERAELNNEGSLLLKTSSRTSFFKKFKFSLAPRKIISLLKSFLAFFSKKGFLIIFIVLAALLGIILLVFTKIAKSEVKLVVQGQKIEKEFEFTVLPGQTGVDAEKMILPGREISVELSGSKSSDVKGKKTVGDKAKGEISIYNGTDKPKTLAKGTIFKGPGGLKFTIPSEVVVPAKTTDLNALPPTDKWGEKKVSAEAADIGNQYNIAANSSLSLESLSSSSSAFLVKNLTAFSGGTSREIQAVSKEDRDSLGKQIASELEGKASEEIKSKISEGDHLLADSIKLKSKVDQFDGEAGDEASTLSVEGKYVFSAVYFKKEDFKILVDKLISSLIQEGYQKEPFKEEESFSAKDESKGIYNALVKEEFLPNIEADKVTQELKAKRFSQGQAYLKTLPNVAGIEIFFKPEIFSFLKFFPLEGKNIDVKMQAI